MTTKEPLLDFNALGVGLSKTLDYLLLDFVRNLEKSGVSMNPKVSEDIYSFRREMNACVKRYTENNDALNSDLMRRIQEYINCSPYVRSPHSRSPKPEMVHPRTHPTIPE